ncbi:hypothetical protein BG004_007767 [Podila humilis]|nr:hypothetical protein BG004_007767 [Podila humilis]
MDLLPGEAVLATFKQDNLRFVLSDTLAPLEASLSVSSLTKHSRHAKRTQSSHHQHQHPQRHYDNCSGSIRHHQVGYNRHQHQELQQHHQHHSLLSNPIASFLATANPFSKNSQAEPPVMPLHHHAQNDTSQNMAASKISYPPRQNLHQSYQQSTAQGHSELHLTPPPPIPPPPPPPSTHRLTTAEHQGLLGETVSSRESNQMTKSPRGAAKTQIILTNYRICLVAKDEHMVRVAKSRRGTTATTTTTNTMPVNQTEINGPIVIIVQVILGSISSINLDEDHRLALRLKFDSLEYTIFVQDPVPPGPPVTTEIFSCLTRILFQGMGQSGVQGRFPFIMGPAILRKGLESADTTDDVTSNRVANLWTAEDIYSIPTETPMASNTKALGKNNKATSLHTALGWSGGYDIEHEYKRLQFRKDQWSIEDINMEFELSPTYPKQFIMPTAFLTTTPPLQTENSRPLHSRTMSPASSPPHLNPVNRYSLKSKMPGDWRHHSGQPPSSSIESETGNEFVLRRGPEDELYVRSILETAAFERSETATNPKLCIMDARAYSSAVANGYIGGGRENACTVL